MKRPYSALVSAAAFLLLLLFLGGCSSSEKKSDTAEGSYAIAAEYEKEDRYEEAIRRYTELKNKFPYSSFATKAELSIADCYYKQESFAEAQIAYQSFRDLHPKHPQTDYVSYRIAMSHFSQLPDTVDRDLSQAKLAISAFDEVLNNHPTSEYVADAKAKRASAAQMLIDKELYIAEFYVRKGYFESALPRFEDLLKTSKGNSIEPRALRGAATSAHRLGNKEKAQSFMSRLKSEFANSEETATAEKELQE